VFGVVNIVVQEKIGRSLIPENPRVAHKHTR